MSDYLNISDFLSPINIHKISHDEGYKDGQLGAAKTGEELKRGEGVERARSKSSRKFPNSRHL